MRGDARGCEGRWLGEGGGARGWDRDAEPGSEEAGVGFEETRAGSEETLGERDEEVAEEVEAVAEKVEAVAEEVEAGRESDDAGRKPVGGIATRVEILAGYKHLPPREEGVPHREGDAAPGREARGRKGLDGAQSGAEMTARCLDAIARAPPRPMKVLETRGGH